MAESIACIRPYQPEDDKLVRFSIGKANLEPLAVANKLAYRNAITVAVWFALSCMFVETMHWWPSSYPGWLGYLRPLPAFASTAVPLLFFIDWINRPFFEDKVQAALQYEDIRDIPKYYSKHPSSGFWILEYGELFVGLIALDASPEKSSIVTNEPETKEACNTAIIRHFYVDEPYRPAGVQKDLLVYAVNHAFNKDKNLNRIQALESPLIPYVRECLRDSGFQLEQHTTGRVGVLRWKEGIRVLEKEHWPKSS